MVGEPNEGEVFRETRVANAEATSLRFGTAAMLVGKRNLHESKSGPRTTGIIGNAQRPRSGSLCIADYASCARAAFRFVQIPLPYQHRRCSESQRCRLRVCDTCFSEDFSLVGFSYH